MPYIIGRDCRHPEPALKRLDHLICRVPDISAFHRHFTDVLGFPEAWPIERFWPDGRTSGIALGGINLEFIQGDEAPPVTAITDMLVFEPTSLEVAEVEFSRRGVNTRRFDKIEPDPELLALRGYSGSDLQTPQLICRNLLLESEFPIPIFLCDYSPFLKDRLTGIETPFGRALSITLRLPEPGLIGMLGDLGYLGDVELRQTEDEFGSPEVTEIKLESGPLELKGVDPGFRFI